MNEVQGLEIAQDTEKLHVPCLYGGTALPVDNFVLDIFRSIREE